MLVIILSTEITTKNKYSIRVDYDDVYEVFLSDKDARKYPLTIGQINDVTSALFNQIRKDAVVIQLVSLHNNPGSFF